MSANLPTRVTEDAITSRIVAVEYIRIGATVTICNISLDSGFSVRGESACVDPANYNEALGQKYAYEQAFEKLWPLFGFALSEQRFAAGLVRGVEGGVGG